MDEHEKLREAIKWARHTRQVLGCDNPNAATMALLADAAESTLPKTKMVEVWHVEYCFSGRPLVAVYTTEEMARAHELPHKSYACIRVTGPHKQEVPA